MILYNIIFNICLLISILMVLLIIYQFVLLNTKFKMFMSARDKDKDETMIKIKNQWVTDKEMYKSFNCRDPTIRDNDLNDYQNEIINLSNKKNNNFNDSMLLNILENKNW